ncbi:MAG: sn-glycerol-1-phosphate dehydrogenase [Anaerolineae bacterium]
MRTDLPVYIVDDALPPFITFCRERGLDRFLLVADTNTYPALGQRAEAALREQGWDVRTAILHGDDVIADARYMMQVLLATDSTPRTYVAVGSGTITDISRFLSHRSGQKFISLPTAASVDGFTSIGAPIVVDGAKITVVTHGPLAVFADLPTLCAAPRPMIAAGFGDLIAKLTSVADWELGHLLWNEPYDETIARRSRDAAWAAVQQLEAIANAECDGVRTLMEGLIESGFCMLDFGETRPASGAEHHTSHLWEMMLLREGRHSVLHGAKVGVAVIVSAQRYDAIKAMSRSEAANRLARATLPDREADIAAIRQAFPHMADELIEIQAPFLNMTEAQFNALKAQVLDNWDAIRRIAATVPSATEVTGWLRRVGGPVTAAEISLSDDEFELGVRCGHFYRNRFSVAKLGRMLGLV